MGFSLRMFNFYDYYCTIASPSSLTDMHTRALLLFAGTVTSHKFHVRKRRLPLNHGQHFWGSENSALEILLGTWRFCLSGCKRSVLLLLSPQTEPTMLDWTSQRFVALANVVLAHSSLRSKTTRTSGLTGEEGPAPADFTLPCKVLGAPYYNFLYKISTCRKFTFFFSTGRQSVHSNSNRSRRASYAY